MSQEPFEDADDVADGMVPDSRIVEIIDEIECAKDHDDDLDQSDSQLPSQYIKLSFKIFVVQRMTSFYDVVWNVFTLEIGWL